MDESDAEFSTFTLIPLYESLICRLCSMENADGIELNVSIPNSSTYAEIINKYLPLNVKNDKALPQKICRDCKSKVDSTVAFLDVVIHGQKKLKEMWKKESRLRRVIEESNAEKKVEEPSKIEQFWYQQKFYDGKYEIEITMNGPSRGRPKKNPGNPAASEEQFLDVPAKELKIDDESPTGSGEEDNGKMRLRRRRKLPQRLCNSVVLLDEEDAGHNDEDECLDSGRPKRKSCNSSNSSTKQKKKLKSPQKKSESKVTESAVSKEEQDSIALDPDKQLDCSKVGVYQCYECGFADSDQAKIEEHIQEEHKTAVEVSSAELCESWLPPDERRTRGQYRCHKCERTFNHQPSLKYHITSVHERVFHCCQVCSKVFRHKQLLQRHLATHSDERPFQCDTCNASFKSQAALISHRIMHSGMSTTHKCEKCSQTFKYAKSLKTHMVVHDGIKPFQCEHCSKYFSQRGNLKEHMRIHTGEKPYQCAVCGKDFRTQSQHKQHTLMHEGVRPFQCQYCHKHFTNKAILLTHERRHTGEKPFVCMYCNRGFPEQWALKKHIRLHTGEKPYTCQTCGKKFSDASNLKKHQATHENDGSSDSTTRKATQPKLSLSKTLLPLELQGKGQTVDLMDKKGNPFILDLPRGRFAHLVSVDSENVLLVKTSEGWFIQLQLPSNHDLSSAHMLDEIKDAVMSAKPDVVTIEEESPNEDRELVLSEKDLRILLTTTN